MTNTAFHTKVEPLPPSAISYFRTRLRCGLGGAVASPSIAAPQALLLFSLTYGAGASVEELSWMRLEFLLDHHGQPARQVRFDHSVTKHHTLRHVAMHPDIAADVSAFRHAFPAEEWVAFRPATYAFNPTGRLPASTITSWFRGCLRHAGLGRYSIASARKTFLVHLRAAA